MAALGGQLDGHSDKHAVEGPTAVLLGLIDDKYWWMWMWLPLALTEVAATSYPYQLP